MLFALSSAYSVRHLGLALEIEKGDHLDPTNSYHWSKVVLNLHSSQDFEPSMPWVHELNMLVNKIAGDYVTFLDYIRVLGFSVENGCQCGRKLSSNIQFLGIQASARKKKLLSLALATWSRCIAISKKEMVYRSVTQDKWEKGKNYLLSLEKVIGTREHLKTLNHKLLE